MDQEDLQEITLKLDQETISRLITDVRLRRKNGMTTAFPEIFLIRFADALERRQKCQIFKIKKNQPSITNVIN